MKVTGIQNLSFKAAPTTNGLKEMDKICKEGEKLLHPDGTSTMFDVYNYGMYSDPNYDTGVGKYTGKEAIEFAKTMKPYVGFDKLRIYPTGRFTNEHFAKLGYYNPYYRGGLSIGEDNIDIRQLATKEYAQILPKYAIDEFLSTEMNDERINYENEVGKVVTAPTQKLLMTAYKNFLKLPQKHPLRQDFKKYKRKPFVRDYQRLALWRYLKDEEPKLFVIEDPMNMKFISYKDEYYEETDFYIFKQYLAYKQALAAKKQYNEMGIELIGDVPLGFNEEEMWGFSSAFNKDLIADSHKPAFRFEDLNDRRSAAYRLLNNRLRLAATMFDGITLDRGSQYFEYKYKEKVYVNDRYVEDKDAPIIKLQLGDSVSNLIENIFKEAKGDSFKPENIMYDAEDNSETFMYWKPELEQKHPFADKNLLLLTQNERAGNKKLKDPGYGSYKFYTSELGLDKNKFMLGTCDHSTTPTLELAEGETKRSAMLNLEAGAVLEDEFNVERLLQKYPNNWFSAKMAELQLAPKRFFYYADVFGKKDSLNDIHAKKRYKDRFRHRLTSNYEKEYNEALQNGKGYNRPEALSMALKARGFDKTNPTLYKKIVYLGKFLRKEGSLTSKQSDIVADRKGYDEMVEHLNTIV